MLTFFVSMFFRNLAFHGNNTSFGKNLKQEVDSSSDSLDMFTKVSQDHIHTTSTSFWKRCIVLDYAGS